VVNQDTKDVTVPVTDYCVPGVWSTSHSAQANAFGLVQIQLQPVIGNSNVPTSGSRTIYTVCRDEAFFHRVHDKGKTIHSVSPCTRLLSLLIHSLPDTGEPNRFSGLSNLAAVEHNSTAHEHNKNVYYGPMDSWLDSNIIEEEMPKAYVDAKSNPHVLCQPHFTSWKAASYKVNKLTVPHESRDNHGCITSIMSTAHSLTMAKDFTDIVCHSAFLFSVGCVDGEMQDPLLALIDGEPICMLPMAPIDGSLFVNM
jgi:hypothetical protein